tara:strand:+ start:450 stop:749 length:300 start_codon:yes stop_codon:yes gene_type:complete
MNNCNCENIALINNDWLCLECGEKTEPPQNQNKGVKKMSKEEQLRHYIFNITNMFHSLMWMESFQKRESEDLKYNYMDLFNGLKKIKSLSQEIEKELKK